jgi:hypothetical protein
LVGNLAGKRHKIWREIEMKIEMKKWREEMSSCSSVQRVKLRLKKNRVEIGDDRGDVEYWKKKRLEI